MLYHRLSPGLRGDLFNSRLEHRQSQKVHVTILLLVLFLVTLCKIEGVERIVG